MLVAAVPFAQAAAWHSLTAGQARLGAGLRSEVLHILAVGRGSARVQGARVPSGRQDWPQQQCGCHLLSSPLQFANCMLLATCQGYLVYCKSVPGMTPTESSKGKCSSKMRN